MRRLLLELLNPGHLARVLEVTGGSTAAMTERDGNLMVDRITYEPERGYSRTERFTVRDGRVRRCEFSLEQIPAEQLVHRLRQAGFGEVRLFGQGGRPFDNESRRLIALARR